ncbi:hypothetical protein RRG08_005190 [Elysia crispata]|uniref:Uncharacterized protein n=1 Tax=Elysia crispata TaxID=231223 RepID=A0AAE1DFZ2_9GAST|nr:hypothetical protein RRG08_005190 [Elysia crispata]
MNSLESCRGLGLSLNQFLFDKVNKVFVSIKPDVSLQKCCQQLCCEFPDLFKKEPGTLKDFELEVKSKPEANPIFNKPQPVPITVQEDLESALQAGINRGIWEPTQFNAFGTTVVPIRKRTSQGQSSLRVCSDYSVTVNPQLETHRHPMP